MNISDAERLETILKELNYRRTNKESLADLILVVACAVRQKAVDRIYGRARRWKQTGAITILTGCVLDLDKIKMSEVFDHILPIKDIQELPALLINKKAKNTAREEYLTIKPNYNSKFQAFVPISTGCNKFCSYCAVPYTRGREVSRPPDDIIYEIKQLIKKRYKEITLLGQNVNSYGWDFEGVAINHPKGKVLIHKKGAQGQLEINKRAVNNPMNFPTLLKNIAILPGDFWIRFITSHPYDMDENLIKTVASNKKITPYIHLAVQSGSNEVLKRMNRLYTIEHYKEQINKIKKQIPNAVISTDIIVGFCGETESDFQKTCQLVKEVKFDMAYIAQYSPRPGTMAARLKDDIPHDIKATREKNLNSILKKVALAKNKKLINSEQRVLFEKCQKGYCDGKTYGFKNIRVKSTSDLTGRFKTVNVTSATAWNLTGELKKRSSPKKR